MVEIAVGIGTAALVSSPAVAYDPCQRAIEDFEQARREYNATVARCNARHGVRVCNAFHPMIQPALDRFWQTYYARDRACY